MIEENRRLRFKYKIDGVKRKHIYVAWLYHDFGDLDYAEWRPAGSLLFDFLNFDLDLFRYGKKVDITTGEEATADTKEENIYVVNAHNFEDYIYCEDGKLHQVVKDENGKIEFVFLLDEYPEFDMNLYIESLPEILRIYADEFIDFKTGRYNERWEELKKIQKDYQDVVEKIFELKTEEKTGKTPKQLYNEYFGTDIKKWKMIVPEYDFNYDTFGDFLNVELHNLVCNNKYVFKCILCERFSISDRKSAVAGERAYMGTPIFYNHKSVEQEEMDHKFIPYFKDKKIYEKMQEMLGENIAEKVATGNIDDKVKELIKSVSKNEFINFRYQKKKFKEQPIFRQRWKMLYDAVELELYGDLSDGNKELTEEQLKERLLLNEENNWIKRMLTCREAWKRITEKKEFGKRHIITQIRIKGVRAVSSNISEMEERAYFAECGYDSFETKRENATVALEVARELEEEYITKYDAASKKEEKDKIAEEYQALFDKANRITHVNTGEDGNPLKKGDL